MTPLDYIPREFYTRKTYPTRTSISCKIGMLSPKNIPRIRKPIELRQVSTTRVSARRSKLHVIDLLECNAFDYFVTLTFGTQDRFNDTSVKKDWIEWRKSFRRKFPNAYYVAVPEYHKKGGLHIHMVLGGITDADLILQSTAFVCCHWTKRKYQNQNTFDRQKVKHELKPTDGLPIFNVGAWELGHSTCTKILFKNAVYNYIAKYISKGGIDPRFCDAKRYWGSKNLARPVVEHYQSLSTLACTRIDDHIDNFDCVFYCEKNCYFVFDDPNNEGKKYPDNVKLEKRE